MDKIRKKNRIISFQTITTEQNKNRRFQKTTWKNNNFKRYLKMLCFSYFIYCGNPLLNYGWFNDRLFFILFYKKWKMENYVEKRKKQKRRKYKY